MRCNLTAWALRLTGLLLYCLPTVAQIKITYPSSRAIFQRDQANTTTIYIAGTYSQPISRVEARVVKMAAGQGIDTDWTVVQDNPQGGVFQGPLRLSGGWYQLQVRAWQGSTLVGQDNVQRVGVGEVFIITGQSNAQGFQQQGANGASDDRVNCITYDNTTANSLSDPPAPTFRQLGADALIGPRGQSAWCWGMLGDLLAKEYNVPVLFINTAWAGTSIRNWVESANGQITKNIFRIGYPDENLPTGMPYGNLLVALRYFSSLQGLRAVLWQQGETDNIPLNIPQQEYANAMQYLVNKTRADTRRYPAWMLARSSYNLGKTNANIINAQNQVINTFNNNVYAGPPTDNIQIPRYDQQNGDGGVHFGGDGLRLYANAWYASMTPQFFAGAIPLLPLPSPTLSAACASSNNAINLAVSNQVRDRNGDVYQFTDITWSNGQKGANLTATTPGTYYAIAKDSQGTTFISPSVAVTDPIQPVTPTITQAGQQQACADSSFIFTTNSPASNAITWSNGVKNPRLVVNTAGSYTAQATNTYGCVSAVSAPATLTIRPRLVTPSIAQVGPYSLEASQPANTPAATGYDWTTGSTVSSNTSSVLKVTQSGVYAARAKAVYTIDASTITCYSTYANGVSYTATDAEMGLVVYPNPSSNGVIQVETKENLSNADVSVYTLSGQRVFTRRVAVLDNRVTVNLSALAGGNYVVRVEADNFKATRRVLIK